MKKLISLMLVLFMVCACDDNKLDIESEFDKNGWTEQETPQEPEQPADPEQPSDPEPPADPEPPVDPETPADPEPVKGKRCFIWIEGNANFRDYGDSRENIARDMEKMRTAALRTLSWM